MLIRQVYILLMCPLFLIPLYDVLFYVPSSIMGEYVDLKGPFTFYILFQSAFYICVLLFLLYQYPLNSKKTKPYQSKLGVKSYACILLVIVFMFFYLFYNVFGDFYLIKLITHNSTFYAKSKVGMAWVFFLFQFLYI